MADERAVSLRSTWSGSISFGLVNVPIKLYSAVRDRDIRFNMIHNKCGAKINFRRFCSAENVEVEFDNIVKGYEISKGRFVTVTEDEIEAADPRGGKVVEIQGFVEMSQIDPLYFDRTYYAGPGEGAGKAYGLLLATLQAAGKVGIGRMVFRTKQSLCCVRPLGSVLAVTLMHFSDEINQPNAVAPVEQSEQEVEMAAQLVEAQTVDFNPAVYVDTHRERVMALIEQKAGGGQALVAPVAAGHEPPRDLRDALEASLAAARAAAMKRLPPAAPPAKPARKAKKKTG